MFSIRQIISALFMIMALSWLTISTPFVYAAEQVQKKEVQKQSRNCENNNPFSNTTEEKNEGNANTFNEYLHDLNLMDHYFIDLTRFYKCHPSDLYYEHHPEFISPPPEV
jgi:hypothetical protein